MDLVLSRRSPSSPPSLTLPRLLSLSTMEKMGINRLIAHERETESALIFLNLRRHQISEIQKYLLDFPIRAAQPARRVQ